MTSPVPRTITHLENHHATQFQRYAYIPTVTRTSVDHRQTMVIKSPHYNPVTLGKDVSLDPSPLKPSTPSSPHILVIGGGVTGLVTSWVLHDRGYRVTVVSKEWC